ncbi:MAG TPA: GNAT family N-acetyltransferase [Acidimicrobiales bacterium]|nr:GNAT family N-acetyltransferase [Acidimicrobiales bacterium]
MDTLIIRPMEDREAAAVGDLLLRANEENLAAFPPEVASTYRAELADVAGRRVVARTYVAEHRGRIVGTVALLPHAADDVHPWPPAGSVLRFLAVDPAARGDSLGERLTVTCIEDARSRKSRYIGLHTAPSMLAARCIYERLGFERAPEHDFHPAVHYGGRADADDVPWGLAYVLHFE